MMPYYALKQMEFIRQKPIKSDREFMEIQSPA